MLILNAPIDGDVKEINVHIGEFIAQDKNTIILSSHDQFRIIAFINSSYWCFSIETDWLIRRTNNSEAKITPILTATTKSVNTVNKKVVSKTSTSFFGARFTMYRK